MAHEQHLQRVGSDRRLLALLQSLRRSPQIEVSLLFRTATCANCTRHPSTAKLSQLLGSSSAEAVPLRSGVDAVAPPAIYEFGGRGSLLRLLRLARFDLILIGLWFWYDPQPSFAEILVPIIRAHVDGQSEWAEPKRGWNARPRIALLADDAHAERARRLGLEETEGERRAVYATQARNLMARQRALYSEVDGVFYLTGLDMEAEAELRANLQAPIEPCLLPGSSRGRRRAPLHVGLLRMPMLAGATKAAHGQPAAPHYDHHVWIGFVGDGHTATNALGVRRFLREGLPLLRTLQPRVRLRLVGRLPSAHQAGQRERLGGKNAACDATAGSADRLRGCGWAWGTPCALDEAACGVDTLGYLSDDELAAEAARWALFLVPIFATTGVNTKLLLGLELGLPVVSTVAAAAPFDLDAVRSDTGADVPIGVADTPHALARLAAHLLQNRTAASRLASAGRAHLAALAQAPAPEQDVRSMLAWAGAPSIAPYDAFSQFTQREAALSGPWSGLDRSTAASVVVVSTCGLEQLWPFGASIIRAVWRSLCALDCTLDCPPLARAASMDDTGSRSTLPNATAAATTTSCTEPKANKTLVMFDEGRCFVRPLDIARLIATAPTHLSAPTSTISRAVPLVRLVHFGWDPSAARTLYHSRGTLLRHVAASERVAERVIASVGSAAMRVDRMASAAGYRAVWRKACAAALGSRGEATANEGIEQRSGPISVQWCVQHAAEPYRARFVAALRDHVQRPRWWDAILKA